MPGRQRPPSRLGTLTGGGEKKLHQDVHVLNRRRRPVTALARDDPGRLRRRRGGPRRRYGAKDRRVKLPLWRCYSAGRYIHVAVHRTSTTDRQTAPRSMKQSRSSRTVSIATSASRSGGTRSTTVVRCLRPSCLRQRRGPLRSRLPVVSPRVYQSCHRGQHLNAVGLHLRFCYDIADHRIKFNCRSASINNQGRRRGTTGNHTARVRYDVFPCRPHSCDFLIVN